MPNIIGDALLPFLLFLIRYRSNSQLNRNKEMFGQSNLVKGT